MAIIEIPVRNDLPAYNFRIDLDLATYELSFRYNSRMTLWVMDILDSEANPLRMGIPVQTGIDLMSIFKRENFPAGDFLAIEEKGQNIDAGRVEFGETIKLFYNEAN